MDNDLARSIFHPDAPARYGAMFDGTGYGFVEFVYSAHSGMKTHHHLLGNILIHLDGDKAFSESYVTATLRMVSEEGILLQTRSLGRYVDRWEKRGGRWAISQRDYVHAMDETTPVAGAAFETDGTRDRHDPSYAGLAMLLP